MASSNSSLSPGDHFFKADGVTFHYHVQGSSGPLIIVQCVGWGFPGKFFWETLGPQLSKANTVLFFEPRGNGQSSRPEDTSTMCARVMADDIEHLRQHLHLETIPTLFGSSHAGAIALHYAEQHPSRVEKLILCGCQVMDSPPNTNTRDWMAKRKDSPIYSAAIAKLIAVMGPAAPKTDEEFREANAVIMPWYFSDPSKISNISHVDLESMMPSVYALQTMGNDFQPQNQLPGMKEAGRVEAKTLIVWGEEDPMCSLVAARALEEGIRGAVLRVIEGIGHMCWVEDPDAFYGIVEVFLAE